MGCILRCEDITLLGIILLNRWDKMQSKLNQYMRCCNQRVNLNSVDTSLSKLQMGIPGLEAMKGMVCETGINAGKRGDGGKRYKSRQICFGCMSPHRRYISN